MDEQTRMRTRTETSARRRSPRSHRSIVVPFEQGEDLLPTLHECPAEITIEATDAHAALALWLNDAWCLDILKRWADEPLAIHVAPTPGAVLHPVVLHLVEMVRRVAPRWRLVGHMHVEDVRTQGEIEKLASSMFHEVRFIDAARRDGMRDDRTNRTDGAVRPIAELLGLLRAEQIRFATTTPVWVRVPGAVHADTRQSDPGRAREATPRQTDGQPSNRDRHDSIESAPAR